MSRSAYLLAAVALVCVILPAPAPAAATPDAKSQRKLEALRDYIKSEDWETVAKQAQELLDRPTDVFVRFPVKQADGKEVEMLIGVRVAANRLLAGLPRAGLAAYQQMHNATAKTLLKQAVADKDKQKLAEVAERFLWTEAGAEAGERLASRHLEDGDFMTAAQAFVRLLDRVDVGKWEPVTLFKAAQAFARGKSKEDKANRDKVWKELKIKAPKGLRIDGRDRTLKELEEELDKAGKGGPASLKDWPMLGGNPGRNGQADGDVPFLLHRWTQPLFSSDSGPARKWVLTDANSAIHLFEQKGEAIIPAFAPITATVTNPKGGKQRTLIVYRDYRGVCAVDLNSGRHVWISPSHWSLEGMMKPGEGQKGSSLSQWVQQFKDVHQKPGVLIENATVGTLSSDGRNVYFIDDLQVPPYFQHFDPRFGVPPGGAGDRINNDVKPGVEANKLQAVNLADGKLRWELGGPKIDGQDGAGLKHDFKDSYFLGPPLPLDGKLYFLNEKKEEIRLVCLDAAKLPVRDPLPKDLDGAIAWVQPLGTAKEKMLDDYGRRINGAQIAYGGGVLVCPTGGGTLVGVDALTHGLLWAHAYGEEPAKVPIGPPPVRMVPVPTAQWKASAPIVAAGKVVFALPDGLDLRCLDLRTGRLLWSEKRHDDDVYLGGVVAGRVLVVGKKDVRALALDDGKQAWSLATGMPSGRGAAGENVYYLPLRESADKKGPEVVAIDVAKGRAVAHARAAEVVRRGDPEVPGNIVFADGNMISQSATDLTAYPLLKAKLELMDELLKKDPKSPMGLFERGQLRYQQGNLTGAVEDFRAALANSPPADLRPKVRAALLDALEDLLRRDFKAGEKYLKEYKDLIDGPPDPAAPAADAGRRRANLLALVGRGYESQGKPAEALDAYLKIATLKDAAPIVPFDDPGRQVDPAVWARGRIAGMYAGAKAPGRRLLDDEVNKKWAELRKANDPDAWRPFVALFSPALAAGREAQLALAERLMTGGRAAQLEAEAQLVRLSEQAEDSVKAAQALEALARLMVRCGLLEDALHYYRRLARDYPNAVVRDGKKGAEFLEDVSSDKRFLPYLGEPPTAAAGRGHWRGDVATVMFPATPTHLYALAPEGDVLPSLARLRVGVSPSTSRFVVIDSAKGVEASSMPLRLNVEQFLKTAREGLPPGEELSLGYRAVGHVILAGVGGQFVAYDALANRVLWTRSLFDAARTELRVDPEDGAWFVSYPDGTVVRVAQVGPTAPDSVILLTRDGLSAIDLLTGRTLWHRPLVTANSSVFGDGEHVLVVARRLDGTAGATRAFRAADGAAVEVPDFADAYDHRRRVAGRLLLTEGKAAGDTVFRLYDVVTGKDVWSQTYKAGTILMRSHDADLAGILTPEGRVTALSLRPRKVVFAGIVDPDHMRNLKQAHLLADAQQIYTVLDTKDPAQGDHTSWSNLDAGLRAIPVNGEVYAFDRPTSRVRWHNQVKNQKLVLEQWRDLPVMLFTCRDTPGGRPMIWRGDAPANQPFGDIYIEVYEKRVGKLFYKMPTTGVRPLGGQSNGRIQAVSYDPVAGKIELVADTYKVTFKGQ